MTEKCNIAVIAAHAEGRILPETKDLAAFAKRLQNGRPGALEVLVLGEDVERLAEEIALQTGLDVRAVFCPGLAAYSFDAYLALISKTLAGKGFSYICAPQNSQGQEYAPALAAFLKAGCISGVNGLFFEGGEVFFQKDVFGGKLKANMVSCAETTVLTVQPGIFRPEGGSPVSPGRITREEYESVSGKTHPSGVQKAPADAAGIAEAKVIVAAGRGIGEAENMPLVHRLAAIFPKAAVAGTRIVCDRGWLPYSRQVGVTGATVAPALYIACGISGASQHVAGMRGAKFVVSINKDPHAAMFNESDLCVVEDIETFIPLLLETFRQQQNVNVVPSAPGNEKSGG